MAVAWGLFLALSSRRRSSGPWRIVAELLIFVAAVTALLDKAQPFWAAVMGWTYLLNRLLMYAWKQ